MSKQFHAALYHRVSTSDQNPALARDELREAAARRGYTIALDIEETGSGANNDRPGLAQIFAATSKIDCVIVYKLDRFGRSALDLLANIQRLESAGVRFIVTSQGLDIRPGSDPMSRLLLTMLAAVAEFERDLIRERTKLGLENARKRGVTLGRPLAELPDADLVMGLHAQGKSNRQIATQLQTTRHRVQRVLKRVVTPQGGVL